MCINQNSWCTFFSIITKNTLTDNNDFEDKAVVILGSNNTFIQDAENKLYNINVDQLDLKELNTRYREAKRAQAEIMTIARQVSQQACDTDNTARIDEVYSLLKSMSNETLTQLQTILLEKDDDNDSDNDA